MVSRRVSGKVWQQKPRIMPISSRCSNGDARSTRAALRLVLAARTLSSQLIDNLNASIHIRALLTDIFLIDETLKNAAADG